MIYQLKPIHSTVAAFYGKAMVEVKDDGTKVLYSYGTPVAETKAASVKFYDAWDCSKTTMAHVKEFLSQEGHFSGSAAEIRKAYGL